MVNGGRPPLPPRKRSSDPGMTPEPGGGGPKLPIPAIQVEVDQGRRWFLRRTESRSTFARPSTSSGQPPPRPHLLRPAGHLRTLGVAGASPAEKQSKRSAGVQGAASPLLGGWGQTPPRPTESVDRHSSEDFRCRPAC